MNKPDYCATGTRNDGSRYVFCVKKKKKRGELSKDKKTVEPKLRSEPPKKERSIRDFFKKEEIKKNLVVPRLKIDTMIKEAEGEADEVSAFLKEMTEATTQSRKAKKLTSEEKFINYAKKKQEEARKKADPEYIKKVDIMIQKMRDDPVYKRNAMKRIDESKKRRKAAKKKKEEEEYTPPLYFGGDVSEQKFIL